MYCVHLYKYCIIYSFSHISELLKNPLFFLNSKKKLIFFFIIAPRGKIFFFQDRLKLPQNDFSFYNKVQFCKKKERFFSKIISKM